MDGMKAPSEVRSLRTPKGRDLKRVHPIQFGSRGLYPGKFLKFTCTSVLVFFLGGAAK